MSSHSCRNCLFGSQCPSAQVCEYYSPLNEDRWVEEYITNEREAFRQEWLRYTLENND